MLKSISRYGHFGYSPVATCAAIHSVMADMADGHRIRHWTYRICYLVPEGREPEHRPASVPRLCELENAMGRLIGQASTSRTDPQLARSGGRTGLVPVIF